MVSIITVNFNQTDATCALLDSIRRQDWRDLEVIVVDNGSRDNPQRLLEMHYPEVQVLRSEQNLGFAGGNNFGLSAARGEFIFFVNNDAELTEGCIGRLLDVFSKYPRTGMVSPLICYFPVKNQSADLIQYAGMTPVHPFTARNRTIGQGEIDEGQYRDIRPSAYAHGAAMMAPRRVIDAVGPMEEDFFLYYEELDWAERIRRAGFEVWVEPRARVYHHESLTMQPLGAMKTYFLTRNRIRFMRRNFGGANLLVFFLFLLLFTLPKNTLLYVLRGQWQSLKAFWQGVAWHAGFRGNPWERAAQVKAAPGRLKPVDAERHAPV